ncbi:MAG: hypothetical protein ACQEVA_05195, partial [Myxococcota bacterium]
MARLVPTIFAALAALVTLFAAPYAFACECFEEPDADVVFFGEVTRVTDGETDRVRLEVEHIMEGFVPRRVEVTTPGTTDACGVDFKRGNSYFVHADRDGDSWTTSQCFGTTEHIDPKSDAQQLREAGVSEQKVAQLEKFQAMALDRAGRPAEVDSRFDTAPPNARYGHAKSPPSLEFLGAALERPNELLPAWEAEELAEKYLPILYEDAPEPSRYADDAFRVLESFYASGDCLSLEEHAPRLDDYTGPYRVQVDRWRAHCALITGDFDHAQMLAERLENRVGYDERTDDMLVALATFGHSRAEDDKGQASFAAYLRSNRDIRFGNPSQRMDVMDILTDLLDDSQLIRSPFVLEATADVVESLPDSENARRAQALASLRAAELVDDEAEKKALHDRARDALADDPDVLSAMETFVEEKIPDQTPEREEAWSYTPSKLPVEAENGSVERP